MARRSWIGLGITLAVLAVVGLRPVVAPYAALPANAAGMAAHGVCSGAFVAGRPWRDVLAQDVIPASAILRWVEVSVDETGRSVSARFPGAARRTARWLGERGCVLDAPASAARVALPAAGSAGSAGSADAPATESAAKSAERSSAGPAAGAAVAATATSAPWPVGNAPLALPDWGPDVDAAALERVLDAAFEGAGDPAGANARGVAVVHRGRLLADRGAPGFPPGTPLHGWSMTKTVLGMLVHQLAAEGRLELAAPVVDAFGPARAPGWAGRWRTDTRARIRVEDLLYMRDGLDQREDYAPWGSVPRMLWGGPDVAAFAAEAPAQMPPGERWRYLSASANLLARVARSRFGSDDDYWAWPRRVLFDPIGARTATLETDADGTWIGSSYLWASTADWARLGLLMARDGQWDGRRVLAPGWLARASAPALADGEGRGYGAQTWRAGDPQAGLCRGRGLPPDLLTMSGHWGQVVAIVPSRDVVIVRLGWTFERSRFDACAFVGQVLATLR